MGDSRFVLVALAALTASCTVSLDWNRAQLAAGDSAVDAGLDVVSDAPPDVVSDAPPDVVSDAPPDVVSDAPVDTSSDAACAVRWDARVRRDGHLPRVLRARRLHRRALLQRRLLSRHGLRGVRPVIAPGVTLDERYRVVRLLGEGAMGAVYEAEHVVIGRRVAVKVMHARFTRSPEAVSRFTREARAAAAIGHPHIVSVTDFGTHGQQPFLVMELLRGETLGERIAKSPAVPFQEACVIMGQVLSALDAAHAIGVVHRDLKPENVFVRDERAASVKLLDFGVSKFHPPGGHEQHITKDGLLVGTPNYMAPEQWTGQRDIDCRADLFAAGVMFFELLTGGLPYEGADERELFEEVVRGDHAPPRPSEIAPGVPAVLDAVVLKAVARERERRYQTAQEFLDALRPFGAAAEIHRAPPGSIPSPDITQRLAARTPAQLASTIPECVEARASRPVARPTRGAYVALVAALLTLTAGIVAGVLLVRSAQRPPHVRTSVTPRPAPTAEAPRIESAPPPPTPPPSDRPSAAPIGAPSAAAVTERQPQHRTRAPRTADPVGAGCRCHASSRPCVVR